MFDVYLAVDWSANSSPSPQTPSSDAIWLGELVSGLWQANDSVSTKYFRTRYACMIEIRRRLVAHRKAGRRVIIGFDFAYGYPAGFAESIGLYGGTKPWRYIWNELSRLIKDDQNNLNNRYQVAAQLNARCGSSVPGPFWVCPSGSASQMLTSTMKDSFRFPYQVDSEIQLNALHQTEQCLPGVQSTWKLCYPGSVGSQVLTGIPVLKALRDDPELADISQVWPFESGFQFEPTPLGSPSILHVEIWPGVINDRLEAKFSIRDEAQVHAYVQWLEELDRKQALRSLLEINGQGGSSNKKVCVEEEGWILGALPV